MFVKNAFEDIYHTIFILVPKMRELNVQYYFIF